MVLSLNSPQMGDHQTRFCAMADRITTLTDTPVTMARFLGSNPDRWILQAERYFNFYQIRADDRVLISSLYFNNDAASWFAWMYPTRQLGGWDAFTRALLLCFRPKDFHRELPSIASLAAENTRLLRQIFDLLPDSTTSNQPDDEPQVFDELLTTTSAITCVFGIGENDGSELVDAVSDSHDIVEAEVFDEMQAQEITHAVEFEAVHEPHSVEDNQMQSEEIVSGATQLACLMSLWDPFTTCFDHGGRSWGILSLTIAYCWQLYTLWVLVQLHEAVPGKRYNRYVELAQATFGEKLGLWLALFPTVYLSAGTATTDIFTNINQSFLFQRIWHIPWVGLATFANDVFELSRIFSGVAGQLFEANRLTASDVCVVLDLDLMSTIKEPTLVVIAFGHNTKVICIDRNKNCTLSSGAANFSVHKANASTCMDATKLQDSHVTSKTTPYVLQRIGDVPFLHTSLHTTASSRLVDFLREMTFKLSLYRFTMVAAFFRLQLQLRGRYSGLSIIMNGVAVVVYKLQLPDSLRIPPMFYVSLLKSCVEHHEQQDPWRATFMLLSMLVVSNCDASIIVERMSFDPGNSKHMVEFIHNRNELEKRAVHHATYLIEQWLIPWDGLPFSEATWDANKHILKTFPTFNLEDKVVLMGTVML